MPASHGQEGCAAYLQVGLALRVPTLGSLFKHSFQPWAMPCHAMPYPLFEAFCKHRFAGLLHAVSLLHPIKMGRVPHGTQVGQPDLTLFNLACSLWPEEATCWQSVFAPFTRAEAARQASISPGVTGAHRPLASANENL